MLSGSSSLVLRAHSFLVAEGSSLDLECTDSVISRSMRLRSMPARQQQMKCIYVIELRLSRKWHNIQIMNLGKADLLAWINKTIETDYMSVESLADGVAYAQILDAVHPGCIAIVRLNFTTRYPEDNLRNLRIVEDALKKLRINQPASFQKMAKGMFQDNIIFLQWLFNYSNRNGAQNLRYYTGFNKRQKALQRQGRSPNEMNLHLMPMRNHFQNQEEEWEAGCEAEEEVNPIDVELQVEEKLEHVDSFVCHLQNDLREQMQLNWKMMFNIDKSIEQRNSLYNLLVNIDKIVQEGQPSPLKECLLKILHEVPEEYER